MKSQGVRFCQKCNKRMPYDRMENRLDSPIKCLGCNETTLPKSTTKASYFKEKAFLRLMDELQIEVIWRGE